MHSAWVSMMLVGNFHNAERQKTAKSNNNYNSRLYWRCQRSRLIIIWLIQSNNNKRINKYLKIAVGAMTVCFHYSILFMKLWSYVQVNMWCRQSIKEQSTKTRSRSQSISVAELREFPQPKLHRCDYHLNNKHLLLMFWHLQKRNAMAAIFRNCINWNWRKTRTP